MNSLKTRRTLKIFGAALAASVVLAACGGGGSGSGPSALDPAKMVPDTSVLYASVIIQPQGSLKSNLVEAVNSIAGKGTAQGLSRKLEKSLGNTWKQIRPWAGQRVGVALTGIPADAGGGSQAYEDDVLVVLPTDDPAAAKQFLAKHPAGAGAAEKLVGHYVLVGGASAVGQGLAVTAKTSLAADAGFKSDMSALGSGELFTFYVPAHQLLTAFMPLLKQAHSQLTPAQLATVEKSAPAGSSVALGGSALHNQFRIDVVSHGTRASGSSSTSNPDVSSLPAGSWLALSLGGALTQSAAVNKLAKTLPQALSRIEALSGKTAAIPSGPLKFVEQDLLPALGPMSLSVVGTSEATLQAGLVISPLNKSAGARLAGGIKQLIKGLPISASNKDGRVAVTFGYSNLQQLLKPSSTLGQSVGFKQALSQLPAGSKASIYLNFGPVAALASLVDGGSSSSASALKIVHRLSYMIAGGTHGHFRLVLATN